MRKQMTERTFKIITYISYFFGISMVAGVLYIPYYFGELDSDSRLFVHKALLGFFAFSVIAIVAFFTWVCKTKQGKKYEKMYIKWQQQIIDNQAIDEIKGIEYYDTLPGYNGKNIFNTNGFYLEKIGIVFFSIFTGISILAFLYLAIKDSDPYALLGVVFIAFILPSICLISYWLSSDKRVLINEEGVKLCRKVDGEDKTRFFPWENIKVIGLSVAPSGRRISWGYLYFTTKELKKDRVIPQYFEKPYVIMLKYRPKVAHCILKYWDKEIRNLEAMKNWKRYIDRLH